MVSSSRRGFSLVELLVVVTIIGVLIGILLPAVMQAEAAFKKVGCQSNFHQWGVAMHNYHEIHKTFPAGCTEHTSMMVFGEVSNRISAHVQLLPYFEENKLHESIHYDDLWVGMPHYLVKIFQCPADMAEGEEFGFWDTTSYQVNCGTWIEIPQGMTWDPDEETWWIKYRWDGVFGPNTTRSMFGNWSYIPGGKLPPVRIEDISDGASATAMMSEICIARGRAPDIASKDPRGFCYRWDGPRPRPTNLQEARADLLDKSWQKARVDGNAHGVDFRVGDPETTWYNHVVPPNRASWKFGQWIDGDMHRQVSPAQSYHSGGVNLLLCDGSVRFINDNVDPDAWAALGSRAGGEQAEVPE